MRVTEEYQAVKVTNILKEIERNTFWSFVAVVVICGYVFLISRDVYEIKKRYGTV